MTEDRYEKQREYERAKARHRALRDRYTPSDVLGAKPAEAMSDEIRLEIERLDAVQASAEVAWRASRNNTPTT